MCISTSKANTNMRPDCHCTPETAYYFLLAAQKVLIKNNFDHYSHPPPNKCHALQRNMRECSSHSQREMYAKSRKIKKDATTGNN